MPESTTIPSPADAVKASLAGGDTAAIATTTETATTAQEAQATETKTETKAETKATETKAVESKSLSDSIVSDDVAPVEKKETTTATDEPREGEKPAQFIKRLKQEKADLQAQLEQAKTKASQRQEAAPDEIAALRQEIAEREALLESTAFEKSQKFKEQFTKPLDKATTGAKELIAKFTDTKGVFEQAKALDGKERMEFLKEHVGDAASTVFDRLARIDEIAADRDATIKDRATIAQTLAEERNAQQDAETIKAFDAQRESIASKLSVFRGENADKLVAQAKSLLTGEAPAADIISAAYLAVAAPVYIAELKAARATIATLEARIAEDSAARPTIGGRGSDSSDASKGFFKDGRIMPMADVLKAQLKTA